MSTQGTNNGSNRFSLSPTSTVSIGLLILIVSAAIGLHQFISENESNIKILNEKVNRLEKDYQDLKQTTVSINEFKTRLNGIEQNLSEIKQTLKELLVVLPRGHQYRTSPHQGQNNNGNLQR